MKVVYLLIFARAWQLGSQPGALPFLLFDSLPHMAMETLKAGLKMFKKLLCSTQQPLRRLIIGALNFKTLWTRANSAICLPFGYGRGIWEGETNIYWALGVPGIMLCVLHQLSHFILETIAVINAISQIIALCLIAVIGGSEGEWWVST